MFFIILSHFCQLSILLDSSLIFLFNNMRLCQLMLSPTVMAHNFSERGSTQVSRQFDPFHKLLVDPMMSAAFQNDYSINFHVIFDFVISRGIWTFLFES